MNKPTKEGFTFGRTNYLLIIAGVVSLIIGFVLLSGGGSEDPNVYSDEIFDTRRLTVAPIILMAGYILVLLGVIKKSRE